VQHSDMGPKQEPLCTPPHCTTHTTPTCKDPNPHSKPGHSLQVILWHAPDCQHPRLHTLGQRRNHAAHRRPPPPSPTHTAQGTPSSLQTRPLT
jgi:hypothetical protein